VDAQVVKAELQKSLSLNQTFMSNIKFIYFDVGNVLVRFEHMRDAVLQLLGTNELDQTQFNHELFDRLERGQITYDEYWSSRGMLNKVKELFGDYVEYITSGFEPIKETHKLLYELSEIIDMGLLSNVPKGIQELNMQKCLVPALSYKAVVKSCDVGLIKPEKKIYEYAQTLIPYLPNEVLFVDDVKQNVEAAQAFGWNAIKFDPNNAVHSINNLKKKLL
jgi:HAD superfamily hydrolase (TIGR01509 family)